MTASHRKVYRCSMLIHAAEDMPGTWIAHCLEFDVVSWGDSPEHAYRMGCEATAMLVLDELTANRDPRQLDSAPDEDWQTYWKVMREGDRFSSWREAPEGSASEFATRFELMAERTPRCEMPSPVFRRPAAPAAMHA